MHLPLTFDPEARPMRAWPMLLYLHGFGSCPLFSYSEQSLSSPGLQKAASDFVVLSPHCDWDWRETPGAWVNELVSEFRAARWIDKQRIYCAGFSMGGMGTWEVAAAKPEWYAAIAPVGAHHEESHRQRIAASLARTPVLAVHSPRDGVCWIELEIPLWRELRSRGCTGLQTNVVRGYRHHEVYEMAFDHSTQVYDWLLMHTQTG